MILNDKRSIVKSRTSLIYHASTDYMGTVTNRTNLTSQAFCALSPWNDIKYSTSVILIKLGSNPNSKLEVVSALNSFNLAWDQYYFGGDNCVEKYNPKVYLGTVQTASPGWIYDGQNGQNPDFSDPEKSGSWPLL